MRRDLVILTMSRKHGGFCVAGVDINTGEWVRPVTENRAHGEDTDTLFSEDITCSNGEQFNCLDIVRFELSDALPQRYIGTHQTENRLIDKNFTPEIIGHTTLQDLLSRRYPHEINGRTINLDILSRRKMIFSDTRVVIPENSLHLDYSLALVKAENIRIYSAGTGEDSNKPRIDFTYHSAGREHPPINYEHVYVTDRNYDRIGLDEVITYDSGYIVMSVGLPFEGSVYKYATAIYHE